MIKVDGKDICDSVFFEKYSGAAAIFSYKDGDVKIHKINKKYLKEMGMNFAAEEIISSNPWDNHDYESRTSYENAINQCITSKEEKSVETWRVLKSKCCGTDMVCIRSDIQLLFEDDNEYYFYAIVHNITEDKKAIKDIEESETKFRLAAEQINVYAWEYDFKTKIMKPCKRCMRDLGLPSVVLNYPEPVFESGLFPRDYYDMYMDMLKKLEEGEKEADEIIPLSADRIPYRIRYITEFDENNTPIKAYGSAELVAENEKAKKEYDKIVHALSTNYVNVFRINMETGLFTVIKWEGKTAYYEKIEKKHYSYKEGVEKCFEYNVIPEDAESLKENFQIAKVKQMLTNNSEYTGTFRIKTDDKIHHMMFKFFHMENESTVLAFQNIDEAVAKQLEHEEKLQEALAAAKKANIAKTTYLSRISHDIRTPLNGILGLLEMIERHRDDYKMMVENNIKIKIAANHLLSLINDVLELGKIEDGNIVLAHEAFSLNELKDDVLTIADMRACESGVTLIYDKEGCDVINPCVFGSPLHLRQIILNIISNSIKYNKTGGEVRFSVNVIKDTKDTIVCRYIISDTGLGMKKEFLEHIFEPFAQERYDEKSIFQGTGLGMAIVKSLVDQMKGTIVIESEEGVGSTFTVDIPFEKSHGICKEKADEMDEKVDISGCNILFVEDNSINTIIGSNLLKDAGACVVCVSDGKQALEKFAESVPGTFDVILMDVMMPVMDGITATKEIRNLTREDAKEIGIIAMTANAFEEDKKIAFEAGMNSYVTKPLDSIKLVCEIAKQIKK